MTQQSLYNFVLFYVWNVLRLSQQSYNLVYGKGHMVAICVLSIMQGLKCIKCWIDHGLFDYAYMSNVLNELYYDISL